MKKTSFSVLRDGMRIAGTKFSPKGRGKGIPVILSHGFLSTRQSVASYACQLARWGYTAYTFDFIGGAPRNGSDGKMTEMSVLTEKEDLLAVMAYVQGDGCDAGELVLLGCSQGGFVSAMVAAEQKDRVKKLILFYPALCIPDDARRGKMMFFQFDPAQVPETIPAFHGHLSIGRRYVTDAQELEAMEAISGYGGEVLILHGTEDKIVDLSYSERACQCYGENASLFPVQGGGHGFTGKKDELATQVVGMFLKGKKEILTVDVRLTGAKLERKGLNSTLTLPFEGFARGSCFQGVVQSGAADVQKRRGLKPVAFCADYSMKGVDHSGQACTLRVINRTNDGKRWVPEIRTDSQALQHLNDAACEAILENRKTGPIVHIFA